MLKNKTKKVVLFNSSDIAMEENEEIINDIIDDLESKINLFIQSYENRYNTSVAKVLVAGSFDSCYDNSFSSHGAIMTNRNNVLPRVLDTMVDDNDFIKVIIEDKAMKFVINGHDGTITATLNLITENKALKSNLDEQLYNSDGGVTPEITKQLTGSLEPTGTKFSENIISEFEIK